MPPQRPLLRALLFMRSLRDQAQRLDGTDDADCLVGFEVEQIAIARDDEIGCGGERAGDHGIVVGITRVTVRRIEAGLITRATPVWRAVSAQPANTVVW